MKTLEIDTTLDLLRGRFARHRHGRALLPLAPEVGVNVATLQRFCNGLDVALPSVRAITLWCDRQDETRQP